jgi:hypothetical protein
LTDLRFDRTGFQGREQRLGGGVQLGCLGHIVEQTGPGQKNRGGACQSKGIDKGRRSGSRAVDNNPAPTL